MRWEDHLGINKISEPSNNLKTNSIDTFQQNYLQTVPSNGHVNKNLEASFVVLSKPSLNEQINSKKPVLFRNGVT